MRNVRLPIRRTRTISDSESTELPETVNIVSDSQEKFGDDNISVLAALTLCTIWCSISVINNIISKSLLNNFPFPLTSTLAQLFATAICADPLVRWKHVPNINWKSISYKYICTVIIPLGIGKFMAACGTHISVSKLPVSYAHTVKASMPIFVVVISMIFFKIRYPLQVYMSLSVILFGVALASITELSFNLIGLLSAIIATASFAFLNILTKRCLNTTHMHHFRLLLILARISTVMFLPIWLYNDGAIFLFSNEKISNFSSLTTVILLIVDGFLNFSQNVVAFTLIAKITPLSYAVCNVVKRIAVIVMSILFFGNPVTLVNIVGTTAATGGVLLYNMSKAHSSKPLLPMYKSDLNGGHHFHPTLQHIDSGVDLYIPPNKESNRRSKNKEFHYSIDIV